MPANDPRARLRALLARNRRRAAGSLAGSPEWDAALAAVEETELELDRLDSPPGTGDSVPGPTGASSLLRVGPLSLADRHTVIGTISGHGDTAESVRREAVALASRVASRREFLRELERLMARAGFVLEAAAGEWDAVTFYAWDARPEPGP